MKKIILFFIVVLLLNLYLVNAITQQEINEAKSLIDSKVGCKNLSDPQLEIIGEYYMEQMMPGEAHKRADEMMGLKEGSEDEEQFHVNMAKTIYCDESGMMGGGMMSGMMGNNYQNPQKNSPYQNIFSGFQIFLYMILTLVIVVLILIIILLINKNKQKRRK